MLFGGIVADSESVSSSVSASDAEQAESTGRLPSVSVSVADNSQQMSVAVGDQREAPKSSDVTAVNPQPTDSAGDEVTTALSKSEFTLKPGSEPCDVTLTVDADKQEDTTDVCTAEDSSKTTVAMSSSSEGSESRKASDTTHPLTVDKEAVGDVNSPVKTRGKSRITSRSMSSNVDAGADLEGSGIESASESGRMKPSVEDKTKTPRVKKKYADEGNANKIEKKTKVVARKPTKEDKAADDGSSNDEDSRITAKVKEEENNQNSKVPDVKEKDEKPDSESDDQKGKTKDNSDQKAQKTHGTRKGSLSMTSDSAGREKRSRVPAEKPSSSELAERSVGRGRRKVKVGPSDIVLSEAENSQEPEQYDVCESSDSASTKLDSKSVKQETTDLSSFEGLNTEDEFVGKISDASVAGLSDKEQCYKLDVCENLLETTDSGTIPGVEPLSRADVASLLTAAFTDSPAYTSADELGPAGGSCSSSAGGTSSLSPAADADEEHTSTKSELEANMEVAAYMGGGSTNEGELSSDEDDDDSSSLNTLTRKPSVKSSSCTAKRKSDDGSFQHSGKRRRREKQHRTRSQHVSSATKSYSYRNDGNLSLPYFHVFFFCRYKNQLVFLLSFLAHISNCRNCDSLTNVVVLAGSICRI